MGLRLAIQVDTWLTDQGKICNKMLGEAELHFAAYLRAIGHW